MKLLFKKSISILVTVVVLVACSTEKDAWLNRTYHGTTSHYNGYFNAKELMKEALKGFRNNYVDDFDQILPIHQYPLTIEEAQSLYSPMDTSIKKASYVIAKHAMPNPEKTRNKTQEWNKWIDDNWLVIGKAHYYKREFDEATEKFDFIINRYRKESIVHHAKLWSAKNHLQSGNYTESKKLLDELIEEYNKQEAERNDKEKKKRDKEIAKKRKQRGLNIKKDKYKVPEVTKDLLPQIPVIYAEYFIKTNQFDLAKEQLVKALDFKHPKWVKQRILFVLAQLYRKSNDFTNARNYFTQVIKSNPPYELTFQAKILSALSNQGNSELAKAELIKMSKDFKNIEYLDQIYFALSQISFNQNETIEGINYLKKSIKHNAGNPIQKTKSYTTLGNKYFDLKEFQSSKTYLDSALISSDPSAPNYASIEFKVNALQSLVEELNIIEREDSLRALAGMSKKERTKAIKKIINKKIEAATTANIGNSSPASATTSPVNNTGGGGSNEWYFYNRSVSTTGYQDFLKLWGNRKYEDNWRRNDKSQLSDVFENDDSDDDSTAINFDNDPEYDVATYLSDIPLTDEQLKISDTLLSSALYASGLIYKEQFKETELAIAQFNRSIELFGENELGLPSIYQLYRINLALGNTTEAEKYNDIILDDFTSSEYAILLLNPNYKAEQFKRQEDEVKAYVSTYNNYLGKRYSQVISSADLVIANEPSNHLRDKYYLLKARSLGRMYPIDKDRIQKTLADMVATYQHTEAGKEAMDILQFLSQEKASEAQNTLAYSFNPDEKHYFVILLPKGSGMELEVKNKISDFNKTFFRKNGLRLSSSFLNQDTQIIIIKNFDNKEKGKEYFDKFTADSRYVTAIKNDYEYFIIGRKNYSVLYSKKDPETYRAFFEANYSE